MNAVAFVMIFLWLPETKQKSLEGMHTHSGHVIFSDGTAELDYVFAVPTRTHMMYQVKEVLPYWAKTQILRRKGLVSPQLYRFDNEVDSSPRASEVRVHDQKEV